MVGFKPGLTVLKASVFSVVPFIQTLKYFKIKQNKTFGFPATVQVPSAAVVSSCHGKQQRTYSSLQKAVFHFWQHWSKINSATYQTFISLCFMGNHTLFLASFLSHTNLVMYASSWAAFRKRLFSRLHVSGLSFLSRNLVWTLLFYQLRNPSWPSLHILGTYLYFKTQFSGLRGRTVG